MGAGWCAESRHKDKKTKDKLGQKKMLVAREAKVGVDEEVKEHHGKINLQREDLTPSIATPEPVEEEVKEETIKEKDPSLEHEPGPNPEPELELEHEKNQELQFEPEKKEEVTDEPPYIHFYWCKHETFFSAWKRELINSQSAITKKENVTYLPISITHYFDKISYVIISSRAYRSLYTKTNFALDSISLIEQCVQRSFTARFVEKTVFFNELQIFMK